MNSRLANRRVDPLAPPILISEDSEADIYFLLRAFDQISVRNPVYVTRNGKESLAYLKGAAPFRDRAAFPRPGVVFLDLYMPGVSGFDILKWKTSRPEYERSLFIALTNSNSVRDISRAYERGANTFLNKPLDPTDLKELLEAYHTHWSLKGTVAAINAAV